MPIATETGGGELQLPPVGTHVARCIQIIDLGTQRDTFKGKPKIIRKVRVNFELCNEKAVFNEERGEESFMAGADYTLSLNERANLRHMLESWCGRELTAEELKGFDMKVLLKKACMVTIIHKKSGQGRNYSIVQTVTPLLKGQKAPPPTLAILNYDIEMGKNPVFDQLPEWIQNKIIASEEFSGNAPPNAPTDDTDLGDDDNVPF